MSNSKESNSEDRLVEIMDMMLNELLDLKLETRAMNRDLNAKLEITHTRLSAIESAVSHTLKSSGIALKYWNQKSRN